MASRRAFTISSIITFLLALIVVVLYNYFITIKPDLIYVRFGLKPIPVTLMICNVFVYFCIYKMHVYAILIGGSLMFCLLGDILLMFYVPPIPAYDNILFLIVGGISFFIGRGIMALAFGVYPYRNNRERCINIKIKKTVLIGNVSFIYTTGMIVYFILNMKGRLIIRILLPIYFFSMGFQLFMSLLRIKGFKEETLRSQLLGSFGTILFTISDSMLFWNIFIYPIPFGDIISISMYWAGMFLITISIVRGKDYQTEKSGMTTYLPLTTNNY